VQSAGALPPTGGSAAIANAAMNRLPIAAAFAPITAGDADLI